jgi:hypothetical protein
MFALIRLIFLLFLRRRLSLSKRLELLRLLPQPLLIRRQVVDRRMLHD